MAKIGILWDMDGVLVDTGEFHFQAWDRVLQEESIPFSRSLFKNTFGMNNAGVLTTLLGRSATLEEVADIGGRKEQRFRQAVKGRAQLLPGVLDWLERLKAAGARQGIASSAPPKNIDALVDELNLRPYFDAVVSGFDLPGKPAPDLFLKVARLIDAPAERCVVVEDAVAGVEAAKRAGMKCIAVTTTNPARALRKADIVVERLDTLAPDILWRLLDGRSA